MLPDRSRTTTSTETRSRPLRNVGRCCCVAAARSGRLPSTRLRPGKPASTDRTQSASSEWLPCASKPEPDVRLHRAHRTHREHLAERGRVDHGIDGGVVDHVQQIRRVQLDGEHARAPSRRSRENCASSWRLPGPMIMLRDALPNVPVAGTEKAPVLKKTIDRRIVDPHRLAVVIRSQRSPSFRARHRRRRPERVAYRACPTAR